MSQELFHTISDPARREIIDLLADKTMPVNEVAYKFDISRPSGSKHIKILNECDSEKEFETLFEMLSDGGQVLMPLNNYGFSTQIRLGERPARGLLAVELWTVRI